MSIKNKTEVTIDRSKWRTGGDLQRGYATGEGDTALLNDAGYRCCLGFIAGVAGITDEGMYLHGTPSDVCACSDYVTIEDLIAVELTPRGDYICRDSDLSKAAMRINDDYTLSPQLKEEQLKRLFADSVYDLKFVGDYVKTGEDWEDSEKD